MALTVVVAPVFLVGASAGRVGADLGRGSAGVAVAIFFASAGLCAVPMGRIAERSGATVALRTGIVVAGVTSLVVASAVDHWWHLYVVLAVAGGAVGLVDTGAARAFVDTLPERRHGLAFGAKEASVPAASLLAGLSLPVLAERSGWRAGFVGVAVLAVVVLATVPASIGVGRVSSSTDSATKVVWGPLVLFAVGAGLGTGAATASATLLVPAFEDRGWAESSAGILLAVASAASISVRLAVGLQSDRRSGFAWPAQWWLMAAGALGAATLAITQRGGFGASAGAMVVIGLGWGWPGLAFQTATRITPEAPAVAAGVILAGLSLGGSAGPALFSALASSVSYRASWAMASAALGLGAVAVIAARRWHERTVASVA